MVKLDIEAGIEEVKRGYQILKGERSKERMNVSGE
jgi:hypothetical protein